MVRRFSRVGPSHFASVLYSAPPYFAFRSDFHILEPVSVLVGCWFPEDRDNKFDWDRSNINMLTCDEGPYNPVCPDAWC